MHQVISRMDMNFAVLMHCTPCLTPMTINAVTGIERDEYLLWVRHFDACICIKVSYMVSGARVCIGSIGIDWGFANGILRKCSVTNVVFHCCTELAVGFRTCEQCIIPSLYIYHICHNIEAP